MLVRTKIEHFNHEQNMPLNLQIQQSRQLQFISSKQRILQVNQYVSLAHKKCIYSLSYVKETTSTYCEQNV
jgi:hypothetical protein